MALIKCPECEREISEKATSCPHCGFPITAADSNKSDVKNLFNSNFSKIYNKIKLLDKRVICVPIALIIVFAFIILLPNGVDKDVKTLKQCLLDPDSLIIYQAYTNKNYDEGERATLFYFGATNKSGGISDDWALVCGNNVLFESRYNSAVEDDDNAGILEHGELIFAKYAVDYGSDKWQEVNP